MTSNAEIVKSFNLNEYMAWCKDSELPPDFISENIYRTRILQGKLIRFRDRIIEIDLIRRIGLKLILT